MLSLLRHTRASFIALAAIVAVMSAPSDALAGTVEGAAAAGRDCCSGRRMSDCGCCAAPARPSGFAGPRLLVAMHATVRDAAGRPCKCELDSPNAPASEPERPAAERRFGTERAGLTHLHLVPARPAATVGPPFSAGGISSKAPLYLLTSRFLC